jgi:hypothetical protein
MLAAQLHRERTREEEREGRLALADPAQLRLGRWLRRLVLTIAPGAARAPLVLLDSAVRAHHEDGRAPAQAALARRIRRRRSDERSSSFRPPQVPYFSGLLTA